MALVSVKALLGRGDAMKVLSLFSGIGGFDLGFERAGMEVVGMCEIDRHAQAVLQRHFPDATLHTDVRSVVYERGTVDVVCGGFPCQDLSVAGKRRGLDGERSGLWFEFQRIIDVAEPAWVVIENVPGLFSSNGGADFAVIIQWLAQRGYGVGWRVLDSQGFGLAQRRKRVFIVGSFGTPHGCTLLLEPESVRRNPTPSRRSGQGDTGAVAKRLGIDVGYALRANPSASGDKGDGGLNTTLVPVQSISPTFRAEAKQSLMTGDGNINAPLAIALSGQHGQWSALHEQSHTLSTTRVEQVCVPIGVRRLTPTECERLQGFPDGWTAGQADSHRYKQLGNAVSVPVAQWIGQRIMEVMR
jgi:DNA (cytosine-5)-methyltransferase 1